MFKMRQHSHTNRAMHTGTQICAKQVKMIEWTKKNYSFFSLVQHIRFEMKL